MAGSELVGWVTASWSGWRRSTGCTVLEGLRIVGMDEKSFLSGQSYASLLYEVDPENSRVLEVMLDRDGDAAELLWETLPQEVRAAIEAVCLDMSGIYREVAADLVPQAKIVHDKFHVSKHLNEAVDKVRAGKTTPCRPRATIGSRALANSFFRP